MNVLVSLDRPSSGVYRVNGQDVSALDADTLASLRRDTFGFVFQRYNLIATASATDNVALPAIYAGLPFGAPGAGAGAIGRWVWLSANHRPGAVVRWPAAVDCPRADERRARGAGRRAHRRFGHPQRPEAGAAQNSCTARAAPIILITHDLDIARHAERIVRLRDGRGGVRQRPGGAPALRCRRGRPPAQLARRAGRIAEHGVYRLAPMCFAPC